MRNQIKQSKELFNSFVNDKYSNIQMLNFLDIPHAYPIPDELGNGIIHLEPTDDFTQFLILSEIMYGKSRISKVPS
tara:strand:+ start:4919 stop:5146 length:228 start_codon:yes stop_codon:yes gene_type:complete